MSLWPDTDAKSYGVSDGNADTYSYCDANRITDTATHTHAANRSHAEISPDTGTAPVAFIDEDGRPASI
jgi:hypothetical protein